jgi:hypothetical protein
MSQISGRQPSGNAEPMRLADGNRPIPPSNLAPLRDSATGAELVQRTPAPNSSAPAVPICTVGVRD